MNNIDENQLEMSYKSSVLKPIDKTANIILLSNDPSLIPQKKNEDQTSDINAEALLASYLENYEIELETVEKKVWSLKKQMICIFKLFSLLTKENQFSSRRMNVDPSQFAKELEFLIALAGTEAASIGESNEGENYLCFFSSNPKEENEDGISCHSLAKKWGVLTDKKFKDSENNIFWGCLDIPVEIIDSSRSYKNKTPDNI